MSRKGHRRSSKRVVRQIGLERRQYSSRIQIDDSDARIVYQKTGWYAAQNMAVRGYNGTATMTMSNDSWLQLPFTGGSLTLGFWHNGVAFSGFLHIDDGSTHKFTIPAEGQHQSSGDTLIPYSVRYDHLACGNHTATVTINVNPPPDPASARPSVYFDWYSYPLANTTDCSAAVGDSKIADASSLPSAHDLNAAPPELKTVAITIASLVAGVLILGILACLLRHRRQRYEQQHQQRGILGLQRHRESKVVSARSKIAQPATISTKSVEPSQSGNTATECPPRPARPDNIGLSEQDRRQIDAIFQPLSVAPPPPAKPAVEPTQRRASWWSLARGAPGHTVMEASRRCSVDQRADTPNFSMPTSLRPDSSPVHPDPDMVDDDGNATLQSSELSLTPRRSQHHGLNPDEAPTTASMSLSAVAEAIKPVAPLFAHRAVSSRPNTAPGRIVRYTSGSPDIEVMFELVDSQDCRVQRAELAARPSTAHVLSRKRVQMYDEHECMPSLDTQWSHASATDASIVFEAGTAPLAPVVIDTDTYDPVENLIRSCVTTPTTPPLVFHSPSRACSPGITPPRPLKSSKRKRIDPEPDTTTSYSSFTPRLV